MTKDDARSDQHDHGNADDFDGGRGDTAYPTWTDENLRRHMELRKVFGPARHGVVDGVEFDLRHPLLDPEEWYTFIIGGTPYESHSPLGPLLWFPWMGAFDEAAFRKEFFPDDDVAISAEEAAEIEPIIEQYLPEQFVYAGDKLVIGQVNCVVVGDAFDHLHDSESRNAYLNIIRADRTVIEVNEPLQFIGQSTTSSFHGIRGHYEAVVWRILKHFGLRELSAASVDSNESAERNEHASGALYQALDIQERIGRELQIDFSNDATSSEIIRAREKVQLVNHAVALGYLWAKAEDKMKMQPLAEVSLRVKSGGERGGRRSGETRRERRAKTWERHARELATAILQRDNYDGRLATIKLAKLGGRRVVARRLSV